MGTGPVCRDFLKQFPENGAISSSSLPSTLHRSWSLVLHEQKSK